MSQVMLLDLRKTLVKCSGLGLMALSLGACERGLVVDDGMSNNEPTGDGDSSTTVDPWEPPAPYAGGGACGDEDRLVRANYDGWRRSENEFDSILATTWEGEMELTATSSWAGVEEPTQVVRLEVLADGTAAMVFGTSEAPSAPTDPDVGYLCTVDPDSPADCIADTDGVPYPVHGARLEDGTFTVPLLPTSPWEQWCEMQTVHEWEDEDCDFKTHENLGFGFDEGECFMLPDTTDFETRLPVDCHWMSLNMRGHTCDCSSDGCFPAVGSPDDSYFELTLSADGKKLNGFFTGTFPNRYGSADQLPVTLTLMN